MTQRIAWSIVLVTWGILGLGGTVAYLAIRQTLLDAMDAALVARAAALPRLIGLEKGDGEQLTTGEGMVLPPGDRYLIRTALGRTIARSEGHPGYGGDMPRTQDRHTAVLAGGRRLRSIVLTVEIPDEDGQTDPVTVVYSSPMDAVDSTLDRLVILLMIVGGGSGLAAMVVAQVVARRTMKPVKAATEVLSRIDEPVLGSPQNRQRRVDVSAMPIELQPIAQRVNQMLDRLDAGAAERRKFLADAAHELRTPVAGLLTTLELLLWRPRAPEQQQQMLNDALSSAQSMRELVEALLDHARSELRVRTADEIGEIDVVKVAESCICLLAAHATARGVRVSRRGPVSMMWPTSAERVRSILQNLLSNAITYSPKGGCVVVEINQEDDSLCLAVSNEGAAISPEDLPHLFKPFYRGQRQAADDHPSHHGLGLYLVQMHVNALDGKIQVRSSAAEGTTFEVRLPASTAEVHQSMQLVEDS